MKREIHEDMPSSAQSEDMPLIADYDHLDH